MKKIILLLILVLIPLVYAVDWTDGLKLWLPFNNSILDYSGNNVLTYGANRPFCYQETTNLTNSNNGGCTLFYTGNYTFDDAFWDDSTKVYDGNFATYGYYTLSNQCGYLYINYSIPTGANGVNWTVKDETSTRNISIPSACFSQNPNILQLRVESCNKFANSYSQWECYNNTWWNISVSGKGSNERNVYEEAIYWDLGWNESTFTLDKNNKLNSSLRLNGIDEYVETAYSPNDVNVSNMTINFWLNTTNSSTQQYFISSYGANDGGSLIGSPLTCDEIDYGIYDNGLQKGIVYNNITFCDKNWHMITITLNNEQLKMYLDGTFIANTNRVGGRLNDTNNYYIGSNESGLGKFTNGSIDEVRIYNKTLLDWEINNLYEAFDDFNLNVSSNLSDYSGSQTQDFDVKIINNINGYVICSIETNNTDYICSEGIVSDPTISCDNNYVSGTTIVNYKPYCENSTVKIYSESQDILFQFNGTINITAFDLNTLEVIKSENISINLYNEIAGYSVDTNTDLATGSVTISNVPIGELIITSTSTNYLTSSITQTLLINETDYNFSIYLINSSDTSAGTLFAYTYNQDYYAIKDADMRLQQYFTAIGDFVEVQQCYSDSNGECVFNIILADERYRITTQATIDGITSSAVSSQSGNYYPVDNTEIELYLSFQDEYTAPDDYGLSVTAYNTTLNGNISELYATFIDIYGNTHEVCLGYYYNDGLNKILASEECTNGSSGTVAYGSTYLLNRDYTWTAEFYTKVDGQKFKTYESFRYNRWQSFEREYSDWLNPLIILIMALLLGFSVQLKNIIIFPIGMIPTMLVYAIMKPDVFTPAVSAVIIFFCVMVIYVGRKRSDNEAT